jgi:hypothetical protein
MKFMDCRFQARAWLVRAFGLVNPAAAGWLTYEVDIE